MYTAQLRLYIQVGAVPEFRTAAITARHNADPSFIYEGVTFFTGDRGAVFVEQDVNESLPNILFQKGGLRVSHCTITAIYPEDKIVTQFGSYGGRGSLVGARACVSKTNDSHIKIEVSSKSRTHAVSLFDRVVSGDIKPNG